MNGARGGRSSRTFVTEGLWDRLIAEVKTGDYVLIQFGHNDGGPINGAQIARGSLPGLGDETQEIDNLLTGQHEIVRTFGWYMTKMVRETKAKGAMPILLSLTVRNIWTDGRVERGSGKYGEWTRQIAQNGEGRLHRPDHPGGRPLRADGRGHREAVLPARITPTPATRARS